MPWNEPSHDSSPTAAGRGPGELDRRLDRFGAAVGEEGHLQSGRRQRDEPLGQRGGVGIDGRRRESRCLLAEAVGDGLRDRRVIVPQIDRAKPRDKIQELLPAASTR